MLKWSVVIFRTCLTTPDTGNQKWAHKMQNSTTGLTGENIDRISNISVILPTSGNRRGANLSRTHSYTSLSTDPRISSPYPLFDTAFWNLCFLTIIISDFFTINFCTFHWLKSPNHDICCGAFKLIECDLGDGSVANSQLWHLRGGGAQIFHDMNHGYSFIDY